MDMHKITAVPLCDNKGVLCFNGMVKPEPNAMSDKLKIRDSTIKTY